MAPIIDPSKERQRCQAQSVVRRLRAITAGENVRQRNRQKRENLVSLDILNIVSKLKSIGKTGITI